MVEKYVCNNEDSLGVAELVGSIDSIVSRYMEKNFFKVPFNCVGVSVRNGYFN